MNDPKRLLDEGSEFERELLGTAERDAGSSAAMRRTLAALTAAAAVGTSSLGAGAATASSAALSAASVVKWAGVGALVGGLGISATSVAVHVSRGPAPVVSAVARTPGQNATPKLARHALVTPPAVAPAAAAPVLDAPPTAAFAPAPEALHGDAPATSSAATAPAARPRSLTAPATGHGAPSTLGAELDALRAVRTTLAGGEPRRALLQLDTFQRSFPDAALAPEASLLRLEALVASGQAAAARQLGQRLLRAQAVGPHAERVRALLGRNAGSENP